MSTLNVSTITDGSNSVTVETASQGSAKAWVNFDGPTRVIRGSFNVASITDNGNARYTITFTNIMPNTNYCWAGSSGNNTGTTGTGRSMNADGNRNRGNFRIRTVQSPSPSSQVEDTYTGVIVFGD